ncbi:hypothetical protein RB195_018848 [Necator americanus]|uniref:Uncharacterized protein n=1 Tax=Necator americanus TaxID=51031 RepID=A0ABR1CE86_NECAM
MLRRRDCRLLQDSKVIPTDNVAAQHHLLIMDLKTSRPRKRHPRTETQRIKWWDVKDRKAAIREKEPKYKLRWRTRQPEDRSAYLATERDAKKAVFKSKSDRYKSVYGMLDTREGELASSAILPSQLFPASRILFYLLWPATPFNKIIAKERTPDVWQTSVTVPLGNEMNEKGDIADCTSYRPIRLLCTRSSSTFQTSTGTSSGPVALFDFTFTRAALTSTAVTGKTGSSTLGTVVMGG